MDDIALTREGLIKAVEILVRDGYLKVSSVIPPNYEIILVCEKWIAAFKEKQARTEQDEIDAVLIALVYLGMKKLQSKVN